MFSVYFDIADDWERDRTYKRKRDAIRRAVWLLRDDEKCGTYAGIAILECEKAGPKRLRQGDKTEKMFLVVAEPLLMSRNTEIEPCRRCLYRAERHNGLGTSHTDCDEFASILPPDSVAA